MPPVHLHYWAGAKAAANTAEETVEAPSVRRALEIVTAARGGRFGRVLSACSLLVDGVAAHDADLDRPLDGPVRVEVLPPFAGGAPLSSPGSVRQITQHWIGIWTSMMGSGTCPNSGRLSQRSRLALAETPSPAVA
jgi:molybdopterin converting factor small subunit